VQTATIADLIEVIRVNKIELGITLYRPASLADILHFEERMGIELPADIKRFYLFADGFESEEDMFRIIPLAEIIDNEKDRNNQTAWAKDFHIAEYLVYCDMWTLHIHPDNPNDYLIYTGDPVTKLTNSFSDFLNVFLEGGVFAGLYAWKEYIEKGR
jgi:hypothetical protein